MCGIYLFRYCLERTAIEGLYSCELDSSLQSLWECMSKFKEKMYAIAFQGDGGMRLLVLKFVVAIIVLYTPDPSGLSEPLSCEGSFVEFNISWLRGGHPLLNIGDLSIEASQSLGLLLDQLRVPAVQTANKSLIILLIKSLSEIAQKRPSFYGRILPVFLDLYPSVAAHNGAHALGYPLELEPWKVLQRHILADHITHEMWKYPKLWVGFLKCAQLTGSFIQSAASATIDAASKCVEQDPSTQTTHPCSLMLTKQKSDHHYRGLFWRFWESVWFPKQQAGRRWERRATRRRSLRRNLGNHLLLVVF